MFPKRDKPQGDLVDVFCFYLNVAIFSSPHFCELSEQSCACHCCWWLMPDCDGALFVSWMCNLPSSCCPLRRGSLFCVIPGNPSDCCPPPNPRIPPSRLCTFTYSCPTGCSETDRHPLASEGRGALPLLYQNQLDGSSHSRWAMEIKPPGTWWLLWLFWNL